MSEIKTDPDSVLRFLAEHGLDTKLALIDFFRGCMDALNGEPQKANESVHYYEGYKFST